MGSKAKKVLRSHNFPESVKQSRKGAAAHNVKVFDQREAAKLVNSRKAAPMLPMFQENIGKPCGGGGFKPQFCQNGKLSFAILFLAEGV